MTLFKSPDQFLFTPAIGYAKDAGYMWLVISWLTLGLGVRLWKL